jgi:steroid delta-isomerase-like uncharacterized protein
MSAKDNKAKVLRVVEEGWNKGNVAVLKEIVAPNYVYRMGKQEFKGAEGLAQAITMFRTAMPDLHMAMDHIIAEGDRLAFRVTMTGTLTGQYMGIPPTGKRFTLPVAAFIRYEDGKEVEAESIADQASMYQQLGIKPPMQ